MFVTMYQDIMVVIVFCLVDCFVEYSVVLYAGYEVWYCFVFYGDFVVEYVVAVL